VENITSSDITLCDHAAISHYVIMRA